MSTVVAVPRADATPSRRRVRAVAAVLVLGLLAAGGLLAWEWRHPTALPAPIGTVYGDTLAVGEVRYVAMLEGSRVDGAGTIRVEEVRAVVADGSARAEITFLRCVIDPAAGVGSVGYLADTEPCGSLEPVGGAGIDPDAQHQQEIVMRIEPLEAGRIVVAGIDVTYRDGWRTGTQRTGLGVEIDVT